MPGLETPCVLAPLFLNGSSSIREHFHHMSICKVQGIELVENERVTGACVAPALHLVVRRGKHAGNVSQVESLGSRQRGAGVSKFLS